MTTGKNKTCLLIYFEKRYLSYENGFSLEIGLKTLLIIEYFLKLFLYNLILRDGELNKKKTHLPTLRADLGFSIPLVVYRIQFYVFEGR